MVLLCIATVGLIFLVIPLMPVAMFAVIVGVIRPVFVLPIIAAMILVSMILRINRNR